MNKVNYIKFGKNYLSAYLQLNPVINFIPVFRKGKLGRLYFDISYIQISWLFIVLTFENKIKDE